MIYKYDVQEINGLKYITGSHLVSELGRPKGEYEFSKPFGEEQIDENGKYQWTIRENPDYESGADSIDNRYLIERKPEPFTPDEIVQQAKKKKKDQLDAEYPQDRILELQDQAIQALAGGEELPREYQDYITFKGGIKT